MTIGQAREVARRWVREFAAGCPGFQGAWIAGSTNALLDHDVLPSTSDLDVMVLLSADECLRKPGKFIYENVLLEVTFLDPDEVLTPEQVLGHYHLAGSVQSAIILSDPSGHLTRLQTDVMRQFATREWVERRCQMALNTVLSRINAVQAGRPFEEQVMSWLFAVGGVPHILLVAGRRNPTVRTRYVAVRELLSDYGESSVYAELLALLDPAGLSSGRVSHHLEALEEVFDAAASVVSTPFPFAADLSLAGRPVAIDGSRNLILAGNHREALFWIVATFARCQMVLHVDAPVSLAHRWDDTFRTLLADLGIRTFDDLEQRSGDIRAMLPDVQMIANELARIPGTGPT